MSADIKDRGGQREVKLTLDADAADLLLQLAGSSRRQGEYVSKLIRAAASPPEAPSQSDELTEIRLILRDVLFELSGLRAQLRERS
jgi:hypothetical protein